MTAYHPLDDATVDVATVDVARLAHRVDELTAGLARLAADLEDLTAAVLPYEFTVPDDDQAEASTVDPDTSPDPSPDGDRAVADGVTPVYDRLEDWVEQYFQATFYRPIGGEIRWCTQWQEHAEAITRLEALWRSWETLRLDPNLGIATWLTNFLDPQLAVLMSRAGTFAQCSPDRHCPPIRTP